MVRAHSSAPAPGTAPRPAAPSPSPRDCRARAGKVLGPADALLPVVVLLLWISSLRVVKVDAMDDWGLLHVLPVAFFVALGLLVVAIAVTLTRSPLSPVRLGLHLVALVVVLHGTVPALFPAPTYPWVYKHVGVTNYITRHGTLDPSVDIYQNWPGFFALAGWFTRMAGVESPLTFAKWVPVYFNLLFCLELAFVLRSVPLGRRERWIAMFLFPAANWVGQDYFAPQALAFVLSLAVFGMILAWLRADTPSFLLRLLGRLNPRKTASAELTQEDLGPAPSFSAGLRTVALACLFAVFAVVVVAHQLSPFLVVAAVGLLVAGGMVRPRWVLIGLSAMATGYLALHLNYLHSAHYLAGSPFNPHDVFASLSNPFDNFRSTGFDSAHPMTGRRVTALGAPALILAVWALGGLGALRRLRARRRTLHLLLLAGSPAILALGQNYGGEAVFRIYLFSLPWTAALAASALAPGPHTRRPAATLGLALALVGSVTLFMASFYGSVELYRVSPGAIDASQYYFANAPPGSVLGLLAPNVPARISANYDQFVKGVTPPPLSTQRDLRHRVLGEADLPIVNELYRHSVRSTAGGVFLWLSSDQDTYLRVLGLMPPGAVAGLDEALAASADWRPFYRTSDGVIYQFVGSAP